MLNEYKESRRQSMLIPRTRLGASLMFERMSLFFDRKMNVSLQLSSHFSFREGTEEFTSNGQFGIAWLERGYPCGKPCSRGTHNETVKNLPLS